MKETLTLAIIGHLVGDYLLQTDWMALNKKKRDMPCLVHCLIWTISVSLFTGWINLPDPRGFVVWNALLWSHYLQDRTQIVSWWMRLRWKDQSKFTEPPMAPWSLIVVDNVWHIVTLWAIWRYVV